MKFRRHHNNTGLRQIQNGATRRHIYYIKKRLGVRNMETVRKDLYDKLVHRNIKLAWEKNELQKLVDKYEDWFYESSLNGNGYKVPDPEAVLFPKSVCREIEKLNKSAEVVQV